MNENALPACTARAFENRYRADSDPWRFATSLYEQGRYAATLENLQRPRYRRAFEPGCSVGALTTQLAERCDEVVATEISPTALMRARERCAGQSNIHFECCDIQSATPSGSFDLIVFSELGYYFAPEALAAIALKLCRALDAGGELLAVHWLGESNDHVLHGDEVHEALFAHIPFQHIVSERHAGFRLDSWVRP